MGQASRSPGSASRRGARREHRMAPASATWTTSSSIRRVTSGASSTCRPAFITASPPGRRPPRCPSTTRCQATPRPRRRVWQQPALCHPLHGQDAGLLVPVAYGPPRSELTGINFIDDTLIVSVQHPSEDAPIGDGTILSRSIEMLKLDGSLFTQTRTVPRGSNWPDNVTGEVVNLPRPCTVGIRRNSGRS
jgi:hypothetical protein